MAIFLLDPTSKRSLSDLWYDYADKTMADIDEADMPDEDDE